MRTHSYYILLRTITTLCTLIGTLAFTYSQDNREYASTSVLAEGEWYKIGIIESGIYKLDRTFFNQLGINIGQIDPRNIQIYGNGGGMLPQANSDFRYDDLQENAIQVLGEEDGAFDVSDEVRFYAEGPHVWSYNRSDDRFEHQYNLYSDTSFYFLRIGEQLGLRIRGLEIPNPEKTLITARSPYFHEVDRENPLRSGRYWLGERFELLKSYSFSFPADKLDPNGKSQLRIRVAARSSTVTTFRVSINNRFIGSSSVSAVSINRNDTDDYQSRIGVFTLDNSLYVGDSLKITIEFDNGGYSLAVGWLDYIELDSDQLWELNGENQATFYAVNSSLASEKEPFSINLNPKGEEYTFWDISNPIRPSLIPFSTNSNGELSLPILADTLLSLIAFKDNVLLPISGRKIPNQNLHGINLAEYVVITHPSLMAQAERLAQFHESYYGQSYVIATPQEIYNEFSSGKQDVTAIRDFVKMIYDQSGGALPLAVLMFGDGTYDYKGIIRDVNNQPAAVSLVPTYQSRNSWKPTESYTSDDFFGILDDEEGFWGEQTRLNGDNSTGFDLLDTGVGRLPVENSEEAEIVVDKIIQYVTDTATMGSWRNRVVLVADHKEGDFGIHVIQADGYTESIEDSDECINVEKIYMDNYPVVPTPTDPIFPEGREALLNELDKGSLIVNYTGHGGEFAWSNSRILENNDIATLRNNERLPVIVTATCQYGRWDEPSLPKSGAELMLLEEDGGAIALFTTVRLVFSSPNAALNANFYREVFTFDEDANRMPFMGEVMMRTKNRSFLRNRGTNINSRNFTLLGDPGIQLSYPRLRAKLTNINDSPIQEAQLDTLLSLSTVELSGVITDLAGNPITSYNGDLEVTVFDKPSRFTTKLSRFNFTWRKNRIFNGIARVRNGEFTVRFVVPIDVSYDDGTGKLSLYFSNGEVDGAGCYTDFFVGGIDPTAIPDNEGPDISLFMNDENWVNGGITSPNPALFAIVSDSSGINTIGSGIGHEITVIIDEDESNPILLNDFYTSFPDSYTQGSIRYQFRDLLPGPHTARVRVWDGANNPAESTTSFIVKADDQLVMDQVRSVPNPALEGESINFWIGHNQAGKDLDAELNVFSFTGQKIKTFSSQFRAEGFNFREFTWDGTNDAGVPVASGMYIYEVRLKELATGQEVSTYEKLIVSNP